MPFGTLLIWKLMEATPQDGQNNGALQGGCSPGGAVLEAFEATYVSFAPKLRKIAVRKFGVPPADAEALVHDVFASYFMHASAVNTVEPYLIGAICNASRHYRRRSLAADEIFACGELPCMATPDEALSSEIERKLVLSRLLARVGSRCRDLLHRYYMAGETTQAIADEKQSTAGTILVLLHKCRRRALEAYRSMTEAR
ncbi:MAG: RNA polymerase sigma factor [Thermoanaerobaculia bacterium]